MPLRTRLTLGRTGVMALVIAASGIACSVEQTEQGEAPDVDLDVDSGRWPQYDVNWADVDVGTRENTVTVPVVRIERETRQITVPYIDINPAGATDREERTITMELDVPNAGHQLQIQEIRAAEDDLWVIGQLTQTGKSTGGQTRVTDQVIVNAPADLDVRKVVVGMRPEGTYNRQYRFIDSMAALQQEIPQEARVIYERSGGDESGSPP
jgi:hypothetical protein